MDKKPQEQAMILLALEALQFDASDWTPESVERHLREQMAMARKHLESIVDGTAKPQPQPVQVYATIRPGTRYQDQCLGEAFKVKWQPARDGYYWKGGIGGQYRHSDLMLHIKDEEGNSHPIPMLHIEEDLQVIDIVLSKYDQKASTGDCYPDWFTRWSSELIERLQKIERKARANYVEEDE